KFKVEYISQASSTIDFLETPLSLGFDTAKVVKALAQNPEVIKAAQLLINARARREAMAQMDAGDFLASRATVMAAAAASEISFCAFDFGASFKDELDDLKEVAENLQDPSQNAMSRKRMAYRRESLRKGR